MKKKPLFIWTGFALALFIVSINVCVAEDGIVFTQTNVDYFGTMPELIAGDVVTAYDPDGVLCGMHTVKAPGNYGFMHVYGDDATTFADEGAQPGDTISFEVNGQPVFAVGPDEPVWTSDGSQININLSR